MSNDMVFDQNTNPVWIHTPSVTRKWLKYQIEQGRSFQGYTVRIDPTMKFVTVAEYLSMTDEE